MIAVFQDQPVLCGIAANDRESELLITGGAGARAGLTGVSGRRIADVITHVDGTRVHTLAEFAAALDKVGVGNTARLTVRRDGAERIVSVTVMDIS